MLGLMLVLLVILAVAVSRADIEVVEARIT